MSDKPCGTNCLPQPGWFSFPVFDPTLSGLSTGMYYFTVTSGDGCYAEDSVLIQNVCEGQITSTSYDPCDSVVKCICRDKYGRRWDLLIMNIL